VSPGTDIAIVGGGPVGAALALALRGGAWRVTVLEARIAQPAHTTRNPRPIALSYGSRLLLERLGAWQALAPAPIDHVHVSQRGGFGRVALNAHDSGVPALGYVVDYGGLFTALANAASASGSDHRDGVRVTAMHDDGEYSRIDYARDGVPATLNARLAVIADGGDIDGLAPPKVFDYGQSALTARVRTTQPHRNTAYERFTSDGPLALLPFGAEMALVWTLPPARAQVLEQIDTKMFLAALREAFGGRLGEFTAVTQRASYPLTLRRAAPACLPRVVAIGNAAQTLHPAAGQGFNLGLRDAWELAQALRTTPLPDPGAAETLRRYSGARRFDRFATVGATHALVRLFSNDFFALDALRGAGMTLLGCVPPARDFLARRMIFGARA
jgi:2-octaprenyl-6-methoxyphenol hydroxylase